VGDGSEELVGDGSEEIEKLIHGEAGLLDDASERAGG
jgi:hypothetical protein